MVVYPILGPDMLRDCSSPATLSETRPETITKNGVPLSENIFASREHRVDPPSKTR